MERQNPSLSHPDKSAFRCLSLNRAHSAAALSDPLLRIRQRDWMRFSFADEDVLARTWSAGPACRRHTTVKPVNGPACFKMEAVAC